MKKIFFLCVCILINLLSEPKLLTSSVVKINFLHMGLLFISASVLTIGRPKPKFHTFKNFYLIL